MTTASQEWVRPLRITATVLSALLVLTLLAFFDEAPGIWVSVGALLGLALLVVLALRRPSVAVPILWALTLVGCVGWLSSKGELAVFQAIADVYEPVRIPAEMAVTTAVAVLGWRRAIPAGLMITVYWVAVPWLAELVPSDVLESDFADYMTGFDLIAVLLLSGPLFIVAGLLERRNTRGLPTAGD